MKFPNKMIAEAYESAKGRVFTQSTEDMSFCDETGSKDYDHRALQWLYEQHIMMCTFNAERYVFEFKVAK